MARLRGAKALDLPRLQKAQQLDLDADGQFADFVEKQGAPVGELEAPLSGLGGPVKAPFSCPNNSASTSVSGRAATCTFTRVRPERRLW